MRFVRAMGKPNGRTTVIRSFAVSFAVGLAVGAVYALLRVKSPAPPIVALVGLLGMVIGESVIMHFLTPRNA